MKILIVEDEAIIAEDLQQIMNSFGYEEAEVSHFKEDALLKVNSEHFDLVLLDLRLESEFEGLEVAEAINKFARCRIIFITAFSQHGIIEKLLKYKPLGYIAKPFKESDIYFLLKKAEMSKSNINDEFYQMVNGNEKIMLRFSDIKYIKADNVYILIFTTEKKHIERRTLADVAQLLPKNFIRVHRSYIVNRHHVRTVLTKSLLIGNDSIPVSSSYRENLSKLSAF